MPTEMETTTRRPRGRPRRSLNVTGFRRVNEDPPATLASASTVRQTSPAPTRPSTMADVAAFAAIGAMLLSRSRPTATVVPESLPESAAVTAAEAQSSLPTLPSVLSQAGGKLSMADLLKSIHTPSTIMEILLAAEQTGYASTFFTRMVQSVPAGTIQTLIEPIPSGEVGLIVSVHTMAVTPALTSVTITHISDNNPAITAQTPAIGPISLVGKYLSPTHYSITHIIQGDPWKDVEFVDEVQGVIMDSHYYQSVYKPWLDMQFAALNTVVQ